MKHGREQSNNLKNLRTRGLILYYRTKPEVTQRETERKMIQQRESVGGEEWKTSYREENTRCCQEGDGGASDWTQRLQIDPRRRKHWPPETRGVQDTWITCRAAQVRGQNSKSSWKTALKRRPETRRLWKTSLLETPASWVSAVFSSLCTDGSSPTTQSPTGEKQHASTSSSSSSVPQSFISSSSALYSSSL